MSDWLVPLGLTVLAYLLGSIPFGFLIGRWVQVDVQKEGSGNIGATNVARTAGRGYGVLTLVLDAGKGALAVASALYFDWPEPGAAVCAVAAVMGHVFPVWLKFRGGKGVATAAGVFAVLQPQLIGAALLVFAAVFSVARVVGVASMVAAVSLPAFAWWIDDRPSVRAAAAFIAVLILVRHWSNLLRALKRE